MICAGAEAAGNIRNATANLTAGWRNTGGKGFWCRPGEILKNPRQVAGIRESASVNIAVLDFVAGRIGPGVSTEQIDEWVYEQTVSRGAVPATLHYQGFP